MNNSENINLVEWHRWFNNYVMPIYKFEDRDEYYEKLKRLQAPFYPKFWIAEKFYEKIRNDDRFDVELKLFFSFLFSCGFFMEYIIDFDDWLQMRNWENPNLTKLDNDNQSIIEIINRPNGSSVLKNKLRWLPFLNRPDGN